MEVHSKCVGKVRVHVWSYILILPQIFIWHPWSGLFSLLLFIPFGWVIVNLHCPWLLAFFVSLWCKPCVLSLFLRIFVVSSGVLVVVFYDSS